MCVMAIPAAYVAYASIAATIASAAVSYEASQQQAHSQEASAKYNAQVAQNNAIAATQEGQAAVQQQQMKTSALISGERAQFAANGVDINSGSSLDTQASAAELGTLDALTIRYNSQAKAQGFINQAQLDSSQADWAAKTGQVSGFNSLLGGASSVSDKWLGYSKVGGALA